MQRPSTPTALSVRPRSELKVRLADDLDPPHVSLNDALDQSLLTNTGPLGGSVQDANLDFWKLEIAPVSQDRFILLAGGDNPIEGDLVGAFDPTGYRNGFYLLRLTARDIGGLQSQTTALVEINTADKPLEYRRVELDLQTVLDGIPLALSRVYSSLDQGGSSVFGSGWSLLNRELQLESNVPLTHREHLGVYGAYRDDTLVYLNLPTGPRVRFQFSPQAEMIGGRVLYRPAWTTDDQHGWTLDSAAALLNKYGARYYDSVTGQPYNPAGVAVDVDAYTLTAPDGSQLALDGQGRVTEQRYESGDRLFFSDSGITSSSGESIQFTHDASGRLASIVAPDGTTIVYVYDSAGRLSAVRNLTSGDSQFYGYGSGDESRLVTVTSNGQGGQAVMYSSDQPPALHAILADLGSASQFTGAVQDGNLSANQQHIYTFSIRQSELSTTGTGHVILRAAVTAPSGSGLLPKSPAIPGLSPIAVQTSGGQVVALFQLDRPACINCA